MIEQSKVNYTKIWDVSCSLHSKVTQSNQWIWVVLVVVLWVVDVGGCHGVCVVAEKSPFGR